MTPSQCLPHIFDTSEKSVHVVSFVVTSLSTPVIDSPRGLDGKLVKRGFTAVNIAHLMFWSTARTIQSVSALQLVK